MFVTCLHPKFETSLEPHVVRHTLASTLLPENVLTTLSLANRIFVLQVAYDVESWSLIPHNVLHWNPPRFLAYAIRQFRSGPFVPTVLIQFSSRSIVQFNSLPSLLHRNPKHVYMFLLLRCKLGTLGHGLPCIPLDSNWPRYVLHLFTHPNLKHPWHIM